MNVDDIEEETGLHKNTIKMELYGCVQGSNFRSATAYFAYEVNRDGETDDIQRADLKLSVARLAFTSYLFYKYREIKGRK